MDADRHAIPVVGRRRRAHHAGGGRTDLAITDAATGKVDMLALLGATPADLAVLRVRFT